MILLKRRRGALLPWLLATIVVLPLALPVATVQAQEHTPAAPVSVTDDASGVTLAFSLGTHAASSLPALLPVQRLQGYDLPLETIPLRFPSVEAAAPPQITRLDAVDVPDGVLTPGAPLQPPGIVVEGEPVPTVTETVTLPAAPLFVLRSGWMQGEYVVVLALSPYYQENGQTKLATAVEAVVPGARTAAGLAGAAGGDEAVVEEIDAASLLQVSAAEVAEAYSVLDAEAVSTSVKLRISKVGIQRIQRSALGAAFVAGDATFSLSYQGRVLPLQVTPTELRFYAPVAQDRWNPSVVYLLTVNPVGPSPAIATRAVTAPPSGAVSTVLDRGIWRNNAVYESRLPGVDGDHYFAGRLSTKAPASGAPAASSAPITATLTLSSQIAPPNALPLVDGAATYSVTVGRDSSEATTQYPLDLLLVRSGGQRVTRALPVATGFTTASAHAFVETNPISTLYVRLLGGSVPQSLFLEDVRYERPARLALNGVGAIYTGASGQSGYRWSSNPVLESAPPVWDISDPFAPVILTGVSKDGFSDTQSARTYVVGGTRFTHTPTVEAYKPYGIGGLPAAHALYLVPPNDFAGALAPLVALRQKQNCRGTEKCKVLLLDVQRIYDSFSAGNVAPDAIRRFLQQYYAAKSSPRLISVVLVGDGTYDPHNYEKKGVALNLVPPYLYEGIDPWLLEAACDRCYGQLTGDDPHTGDGQLFIPEIAIGRFPVNTRDDLVNVVNKIVRYETGVGGQRSSIFFFADNYFKKTDSGAVQDRAGDFAAESDTIRSLYRNASWALAPRVYYDPYPDASVELVGKTRVAKPSHKQEPWRFADPAAVNAQIIAALKAGPAIAVYNGHSNHFNMGDTERGAPYDAVLKLNDNVQLNNADRLYVQLSMTCLTAQFAKPTDAGQVIDERMFIHAQGGAVAVWGSTGQSVVQGHARLQEGFFQKLHAANGRFERLDKLLEEGYTQVAFHSTGELDVLRTFVLFGDPLMRVRFTPGRNIFLPTVFDN